MAGGWPFVVLLAGGSWFVYRDWQHESKTCARWRPTWRSPTPSLAEIAENTIPKSAQETLQKAVYLVAKI